MTITSQKRKAWIPPWLQAYLLVGQGLILCLATQLFDGHALSLAIPLNLLPILILTAIIRIRTQPRLSLMVGHQKPKPVPIQCDNHALWAIPLIIALQVMLVLSLHFASCKAKAKNLPQGEVRILCNLN